MADTALEQLLRLREQQHEREARLFQQAKEELLEEYSALKKKFTTVGIPMPGYGASAPATVAMSVARRRSPDKPCKICNVTGHDGRSHKAQKVKRPFTRDELQAMEG